MRRKETFRKNPAFWVGVIFVVVEGLLSGCTYMSLYFLLNMLQDRRVAWESLLLLTCALAGVFVARLIIYGIGYTEGQIGGARVSRHIRLSLGDKFKRIPLARFTEGQVGQYVNTMSSDVSGYEQVLTHKTGAIAKNVTLSAMLIGCLCWFYPPAGLIMLGSELLLVPELWLSFRTVKKYGVAKNRVSAEAVSGIVEYVAGIQTFRAYGAAGVKNRATTDAMRAYSEVNYQYEAHGIPIGFGFNILHSLTIPLVAAGAAVPWAAGTLSGVGLLIVCMLPILLVQLTASVLIDLFSYKNMMISRANIGKVMDEAEETGSDAPFAPEGHDVTLQNVGFSYVPGEPVLKGVSFTAPDGRLTAIVGPSGSGKSTILNLISKYYVPDAGSVSIGGRPIGPVAAERVLEQISMVDQEVFLFNDTVRENIRHARPGATDAQVEAACGAANCGAFISRLEKGYDTEIGENGKLLSGGERQRLSIARAILKDSPILLLDEATASLDIENELAVKQAVAALLSERKTVVMIAHTLSVVQNADQIVVVDGGTVVETGTHRELLEQNGKYAAMWAAERSMEG